MDHVEVRLDHPIVSPVDKKQIVTVRMRRPILVGDFRAATRAGASLEERNFQLVCRMAGLDAREVEMLQLPDYFKCVEALDFGDDDPKAPSSSSG